MREEREHSLAMGRAAGAAVIEGGGAPEKAALAAANAAGESGGSRDCSANVAGEVMGAAVIADGGGKREAVKRALASVHEHGGTPKTQVMAAGLVMLRAGGTPDEIDTIANTGGKSLKAKDAKEEVSEATDMAKKAALNDGGLTAAVELRRRLREEGRGLRLLRIAIARFHLRDLRGSIEMWRGRVVLEMEIARRMKEEEEEAEKEKEIEQSRLMSAAGRAGGAAVIAKGGTVEASGAEAYRATIEAGAMKALAAKTAGEVTGAALIANGHTKEEAIIGAAAAVKQYGGHELDEAHAAAAALIRGGGSAREVEQVVWKTLVQNNDEAFSVRNAKNAAMDDGGLTAAVHSRVNQLAQSRGMELTGATSKSRQLKIDRHASMLRMRRVLIEIDNDATLRATLMWIKNKDEDLIIESSKLKGRGLLSAASFVLSASFAVQKIESWRYKIEAEIRSQQVKGRAAGAAKILEGGNAKEVSDAAQATARLAGAKEESAALVAGEAAGAAVTAAGGSRLAASKAATIAVERFHSSVTVRAAAAAASVLRGGGSCSEATKTACDLMRSSDEATPERLQEVADEIGASSFDDGELRAAINLRQEQARGLQGMRLLRWSVGRLRLGAEYHGIVAWRRSLEQERIQMLRERSELNRGETAMRMMRYAMGRIQQKDLLSVLLNWRESVPTEEYARLQGLRAGAGLILAGGSVQEATEAAAAASMQAGSKVEHITVAGIVAGAAVTANGGDKDEAVKAALAAMAKLGGTREAQTEVTAVTLYRGGGTMEEVFR